jgi:plastocyanin
MRARGGTGRRTSIDVASTGAAPSAGPSHARRAYSSGVLSVGVLVGVLALAATGCGGGDDDGGAASATTAAPATTSAPATTAGGGGGDELQLTASGTAWDTTSLDMTAGAEVSVEVDNQDSVQHNFTFAEAQADMDIPANENATASFTAPAAGTYDFLCKFHPSAMKGTVTVT